MDAETLAVYCGGYWVNKPDNSISGVETDTRKELENRLFVALKGERFDAHDFLGDAFKKGAYLCVNKSRLSDVPAGACALVVDDTLEAYQMIASGHRKSLADLQLIGVTGSVGKTSVKEMLKAIMCEHAGAEHVVSTAGNTNNHIGVPQNLLRLTSETRCAVIEMGTSSFGEIALLSRLAEPDVALVNSIAPCHLENLRDLEGVATEKGDIYKFLKAGGTAVLPCDIAESGILKNSAGSNQIITFGESGTHADVTSKFISGDLKSSTFELTINHESFIISWQLTGAHQSRNASAAAAAALAAGVPAETIACGLQNTALPGMRGKILSFNGADIFNDAYNASPASMAAVLKMFAESTKGKQITLLLGTMLELGENSRSEHRRILELARELMPEAAIITVGSGFESLDGADIHFSRSSEAAETVREKCVPDSVMLVKGSRGTALEKALPQEVQL